MSTDISATPFTVPSQALGAVEIAPDSVVTVCEPLAGFPDGRPDEGIDGQARRRAERAAERDPPDQPTPRGVHPCCRCAAAETASTRSAGAPQPRCTPATGTVHPGGDPDGTSDCDHDV